MSHLGRRYIFASPFEDKALFRKATTKELGH